MRLIVNDSNSSMQPLSGFGNLINKTVIAKISQGNSASIKVKDPVGQHFAKVVGDCHKLHTLLLLQTADCYEETKAIMKYFGELLEVRQLKKRHKSINSKCKDLEDCAEREDGEEFEGMGEPEFASKRTKPKKRVKVTAEEQRLPLQQQDTREEDQEYDHENAPIVGQKIYAETSPKELRFNESESLLQQQGMFARPQLMNGNFEIPAEPGDPKAYILERDHNEQRSLTVPDITREQLTEKIIRDPHEQRPRANKGYRSQQDMIQQKDSYVESHDQLLSVPNDAIET